MRNIKISVSGHEKPYSTVKISYTLFSNITSYGVSVSEPQLNIAKEKFTELLNNKLQLSNKLQLPFDIEALSHHHIASYFVLLISITVAVIFAYKIFKERITHQQPVQPKEHEVPLSNKIRDC